MEFYTMPTTGKKKLSSNELHIMKLIKRDAEKDGWTVISTTLYKIVASSLPAELSEFKQNEDGSGYGRLTAEGLLVLETLEWVQ